MAADLASQKKIPVIKKKNIKQNEQLHDNMMKNIDFSNAMYQQFRTKLRKSTSKYIEPNKSYSDILNINRPQPASDFNNQYYKQSNKEIRKNKEIE